MHDINSRLKLAGAAQGALARLQANRNAPVEESSRTMKLDFQRQIFEEYDESSFEDKVKLDSMFYRMMFRRLDEEYVEPVRMVLTKMFETTKEIYEHLNIKPRLYGFQWTSLNESEDILEESALRMINDFVNQHYYSLTQEQREERYLHPVRKLAGDAVISEGVNEEDAIKYATKAAVMQQLIERVNFPLAVRSNVEELLTDENYGKIFEQNRLREIWDLFQEQCYDISRMVATVI